MQVSEHFVWLWSGERISLPNLGDFKRLATLPEVQLEFCPTGTLKRRDDGLPKGAAALEML